MSAMTDNQIAVIRAIARNDMTEAKRAAIAACAEDTSKKNSGNVRYLKNLLENGSMNAYELPPNVKGLVQMVDVSDFQEGRYYVSKEQEKLFEEILRADKVSEKMLELKIPYLNSTLLYGIPGTGKTEFGKYVAHKLGLPYAYVRFSHLIESYLGNTSKNITRIFEYFKYQRCVLMLDELDCIGIRRGTNTDTGADGELARTTIALMQALDDLMQGQIVIAATNRVDRIDPALERRFQRKFCFEPFGDDENISMVTRCLEDISLPYDREAAVRYAAASAGQTQANIWKHIVEAVAEAIEKQHLVTL